MPIANAKIQQKKGLHNHVRDRLYASGSNTCGRAETLEISKHKTQEERFEKGSRKSDPASIKLSHYWLTYPVKLRDHCILLFF